MSYKVCGGEVLVCVRYVWCPRGASSVNDDSGFL